jgi:RNA polymerase sigma-70 factor (ECF subfamily)
MAYRQKRLRDKVLFSDALLASLASEAIAVDDKHEERAAALEKCLELLPTRSRTAIRLRYTDELNVGEMARQLGRNVNAVYQLLFRARQTLIECVQKSASTETT